MVSIKKSKKPFKNTKIRPAKNVTRVEVGSPNPGRGRVAQPALGRPHGSSNPRWSTRAGLPALGRPRGSSNPRWSTRAGSSWVIRAGRPTRAGLSASASVVQPSSPARVRKPAVVYPGSTRVDMPLVNRS
ncbi:hypothetical protein F2Q68_00031664 [Brassica cretica]|uniref:Uncharacterized protein n=1 Tax=Brassica cretica TaxID=69181 RepID=A0A8S9GDG8_BRACR|nr:hypothetical protein F2Q68_00031664 [Brassica cretica]